jgi:hypothetical protein
MAKTGSGRRWVVAVGVVAAALVSFTVISGGCQKKESASEKAGREAREAFEKSKDLLKEGVDKTKDLTKEGLSKTQEAAKDFEKGWKAGGEQRPAKP